MRHRSQCITVSVQLSHINAGLETAAGWSLTARPLCEKWLQLHPFRDVQAGIQGPGCMIIWCVVRPGSRKSIFDAKPIVLFNDQVDMSAATQEFSSSLEVYESVDA